jgi:thiamine biosynthesis lipoprotein
MDRRALFGRLLRPPAEGGRWLRTHRTAMACRFEVALPPADAKSLDAARAALDEVDAVEAALSLFRETSEVSQVNRRAAEGPVAITPSLLALLSLCRELHAAIGGAFDPASAALAHCWGFVERRPRRPTDEEIEAARARSGLDKVVVDGLARTVRFAVPGVELNFGAIAKGWALDRVATSLRLRGVARALLTAGGSSHRGWGDQSWEVPLRPGGEELAVVHLRDGALGTSAAGESHLEAGGQNHGRVLDPRTGRPAEGVLGVGAVASEAAVAEALASAFLVGGPDLAGPFCAARPGTMALLVVEARPRQIQVFGKRDGLVVDPAPGIRVVEMHGTHGGTPGGRDAPPVGRPVR